VSIDYASLAEDPGTATAMVTRPADAGWPRLVRGQRVTSWRGPVQRVEILVWRVTEVGTAPDGDETYQLEPAEAVDARIEAARLRP
jgi:hypothetical protein